MKKSKAIELKIFLNHFLNMTAVYFPVKQTAYLKIEKDGLFFHCPVKYQDAIRIVDILTDEHKF